MAEHTAVEMVREAVASWEGVTTHDHRFGGVEYSIDKLESTAVTVGEHLKWRRGFLNLVTRPRCSARAT